MRWKVANDLQSRPAISEPETPSSCCISGHLDLSMRKSLTIAIVRFWCAMCVHWGVSNGIFELAQPPPDPSTLQPCCRTSLRQSVYQGPADGLRENGTICPFSVFTFFFAIFVQLEANPWNGVNHVAVWFPLPKDPTVLKILRDSELLPRSVFTTPPPPYLLRCEPFFDRKDAFKPF